MLNYVSLCTPTIKPMLHGALACGWPQLGLTCPGGGGGGGGRPALLVQIKSGVGCGLSGTYDHSASAIGLPPDARHCQQDQLQAVTTAAARRARAAQPPHRLEWDQCLNKEQARLIAEFEVEVEKSHASGQKLF